MHARNSRGLCATLPGKRGFVCNNWRLIITAIFRDAKLCSGAVKTKGVCTGVMGGKFFFFSDVCEGRSE